jgi:hypothetical protein
MPLTCFFKGNGKDYFFGETGAMYMRAFLDSKRLTKFFKTRLKESL